MARATDVQTVSPCSYNPFDGPNENPEAELPLTAGKYLYVYGDMDEDGFYEGLWMRCGWWALTWSMQKTSLPGSWEMRQPPTCSGCLLSVMSLPDCLDSGAGFLSVNGSRWLALGSLGRAAGQLCAGTDGCCVVISHFPWETG